MTKLKTEFTPKQWKKCCGKGCKKCEIVLAYVEEYGRSDGLKKLKADHKEIKMAAKKAKKAKGKDGKKAKAKDAKKAKGKKIEAKGKKKAGGKKKKSGKK